MKIPPPETEYLVMYQLPDEDEPYCPSQFLSYFSAYEYVQIMMSNKKYKNAKIEIVARTTTYEVM